MAKSKKHTVTIQECLGPQRVTIAASCGEDENKTLDVVTDVLITFRGIRSVVTFEVFDHRELVASTCNLDDAVQTYNSL